MRQPSAWKRDYYKDDKRRLRVCLKRNRTRLCMKALAIRYKSSEFWEWMKHHCNYCLWLILIGEWRLRLNEVKCPATCLLCADLRVRNIESVTFDGSLNRGDWTMSIGKYAWLSANDQLLETLNWIVLLHRNWKLLNGVYDRSLRSNELKLHWLQQNQDNKAECASRLKWSN